MAKSRGVVRRVTSFMVRKDGVRVLTMWAAMVVAALPVLTPSLFSASSWETSLFSVSLHIFVQNNLSMRKVKD